MTKEELDLQIADIVSQLSKPESERFSGAAGDLSITRRDVKSLERSLATLRAERARLENRPSFSLGSFRKG